MPDQAASPALVPLLTVEQLQAQIKGLEEANLQLQARALEAELGALQSTQALIQLKGPIAENQLLMVQRQLAARRQPPEAAA